MRLYAGIYLNNIFQGLALSFTIRYTDDLLVLNISHMAEAVKEMYPPSLDLKEMTDTFMVQIRICAKTNKV